MRQSFAWIPRLTEKVPHLIEFYLEILDHHFTLILDPEDPDPQTFRVEVNLIGGHEFVDVTLDSGFLVYNGLDDIPDSVSDIVMNHLNSFLKSKYHVDMTHSDRGIPLISADNLEQAIEATARSIVDTCEYDIGWINSTDDMTTLNEAYLECQGYIEYGKSFMKLYSDHLPDDRFSFIERLEALDRFVDSMYNARINLIHDMMARSSDARAAHSERLVWRS